MSVVIYKEDDKDVPTKLELRQEDDGVYLVIVDDDGYYLSTILRVADDGIRMAPSVNHFGKDSAIDKTKGGSLRVFWG